MALTNCHKATCLRRPALWSDAQAGRPTGWTVVALKAKTSLDLLLRSLPHCQRTCGAELPLPGAGSGQGEAGLTHHYPAAALQRPHSRHQAQLPWPRYRTHHLHHRPDSETVELTRTQLGALVLSATRLTEGK